MFAVCHNKDLSGSWEYADDPENFSMPGIRIAVSDITYAVTH